MKFTILTVNKGVNKRQKEINYVCAVVCIQNLIKSCANETQKQENLALPSFPKIAALHSTGTALALELKNLRVTDYTRIAFIRRTFETRVRAYHAFCAEVEPMPT